MAILTTSLGTVELSIVELRALLTDATAKVSETNFDTSAKVDAIVAETAKVEIEREDVTILGKTFSTVKSAGKHKLACGHSVPVSRGRYPAACDACKADATPGPTPAPKKAEDAPVKRSGGFKRGGKSGGFDQAKFDKWMEVHGDEDMIERWAIRIRWMIETGYKISKREQVRLLARLNSGLTNRQASALRQEIVTNYKRA